MRNLARINNFANRQAAWEDWRRLEQQARNAGCTDLAATHRPANEAGWREIDKATAALRQAMAQQPLLEEA